MTRRVYGYGAEEDQRKDGWIRDDMSKRGVSAEMTADRREWKNKKFSAEPAKRGTNAGR